MTQQEVLDQVYLVLGNPSTDLLPNDIVNHFIDQWEVLYPLNDKDCILTYKSVVSSANYIISALTTKADIAGRKVREKEGLVEIEVDNKEKGSVDGWKDWLKNFIKNPYDLLPCLEQEEDFNTTAMPIVTGLDRDKYEKVLSNSNNISNGARIGSLWNTSDNRCLDSFITGRPRNRRSR